MSALIDRTGQTFNGITIIQELGRGKIVGKCIHCGSEKEYKKCSVVACDYYSCGCINHRFIDHTGQTFGGITIIKEIGKGSILGKCIYCGSEREYNKHIVSHNGYYSCGCINHNFIDRTGQTFGGITVVKELGENKVIGKCIYCGSEKEYHKDHIIAGKNKSCGCCGRTKFVSLVGQEYNDLMIVKELRNGMVLCKCKRCGLEAEYRKNNVKAEGRLCYNCGVKTKSVRRVENHVINNVTVIKYEYRGRDDKPYYTCKCNKCGEEILLSYNEIFEYQCKED